MEVAFENALAASVLLAIPALIQWKWSRAGALFCVAVLVGILTTIVAYMPVSGPGDAVVGRGWLVIYGMLACFVMIVVAATIFLATARRGPAPRDVGSESDSVAMFNRAKGDEKV